MERVSQDTHIVPDNQYPTELKQFRNAIVSQPTTVGGDIAALFTIQQGQGSNNRIGEKIRIRQIRGRGCIMSNPDFLAVVGGANCSDIVRVTLFVDKQYNNAFLPIINSLFPYANSLSPYNADNADRYVILDDQFFTIGPLGTIYTSTTVAGTTTGGFQSNVFLNACKLYTTCIDCDIPVRYAKNSFDPITNAFFWCVTTMNNNCTVFQINYEIFYSDM